MTHGELLYLLLIIASFVAFGVVLAYQSVRQGRAARDHIAPRPAPAEARHHA